MNTTTVLAYNRRCSLCKNLKLIFKVARSHALPPRQKPYFSCMPSRRASSLSPSSYRSSSVVPLSSPWSTAWVFWWADFAWFISHVQLVRKIYIVEICFTCSCELKKVAFLMVENPFYVEKSILQVLAA